jgi:hypothetical protein
VSNPESFIDEVTEEVRRDKLFAMFRKYGWIAVLAVLLIVGGAAWNEWRKAQEIALAKAFGDAVFAALEAPTPELRRELLAGLPADGEQAAIRDMLLSSDPETDRAGSLAALQSLEANTALPVMWRDLAVLKRVVLLGAELPPAEARAALDPIAAPGRPYRVLALEQLAYLTLTEGKRDDAIAQLTALTQDQEAPQGLRRRAAQMVVALGGDLAPPAPAAEAAPEDGAAAPAN